MKSPAWSFLPVLLSLAHLGGGVEVILPYIGAQEVRNPERGFVARCPLMEGKLSIYSLDRTDGIFTRETGATVSPTLCGARILLANHADGSPITQQELDEIEYNFLAVRAAGRKAIVRVVYDISPAGADPADIVTVATAHLSQLSPLLARHQALIAWVQAGLVGQDGEWRNSANDHGLSFGSSSLDEAQRQSLASDLLAALHDALPTGPRCIRLQVPLPEYARELLKVTAGRPPPPSTAAVPVAEGEGVCTLLARLAHHNTCWLGDDGTSNDDDGQTYEGAVPALELGSGQMLTAGAPSRGVWLEELSAFNKHAPWSGRLCGAGRAQNLPMSHCHNAVTEAARLRATSVSLDDEMDVDLLQLNNQVANAWNTANCFPSLERAMGYRLVATSAASSLCLLRPEQPFSFSLSLFNIGPAAPASRRPALLRLLRPPPAAADAPIALDGLSSDWASLAPAPSEGSEAEGDAQAGYLDVVSLKATDDAYFVYVHVAVRAPATRTDADFSSLRVLLDLTGDGSSGLLGCDLELTQRKTGYVHIYDLTDPSAPLHRSSQPAAAAGGLRTNELTTVEFRIPRFIPSHTQPIATNAPTASPTASPTATPTAAPTAAPSVNPTTAPTANPTSSNPTTSPSIVPTANPTFPTPTANPTTSNPTTANPTTANPTANPTPQPTRNPTHSPTASPTVNPTANPTANPTGMLGVAAALAAGDVVKLRCLVLLQSEPQFAVSATFADEAPDDGGGWLSHTLLHASLDPYDRVVAEYPLLSSDVLTPMQAQAASEGQGEGFSRLDSEELQRLVEPRLWLGGGSKVHLLAQLLGPALPEAELNVSPTEPLILAVHLPDAAAELGGDPRYSIRLANAQNAHEANNKFGYFKYDDVLGHNEVLWLDGKCAMANTVNAEPDGTVWQIEAAPGGNSVWRKAPVTQAIVNVGSSLTVLQPSDLTVWSQGANVTVEWVATNLEFDSDVKIELFIDHKHEDTYVKAITHSTQAITTQGLSASGQLQLRGSFTWQCFVPDAFSVDYFYKVVVTSLDDQDVQGENRGKLRILEAGGETRSWDNLYTRKSQDQLA